MRSEPSLGFTTVELIVVIVVVTMLAAIAIPKLVDRRGFDSRAFYDRAQSVVRQAQKVAIARRVTASPIYVCVAAGSISAGTNSTCSTLLPNPAGSGSLSFTAPSGVTLSPTGNFSFDAQGQPSAAVTLTLTSTIPGDPARQITVAALTGYVQHSP
jgi:MSHA pilin protein MshC